MAATLSNAKFACCTQRGD